MRGLRARLSAHYGGSLAVVLLAASGAMLWQHRVELYDALDHHLEEDLAVVLQMLHFDGDEARWRSPDSFDPGYNAGSQRWVELWAGDGRLEFVRGTAQHEALQRAIGPPGRETGLATRTPAGVPPVRVLVRHDVIEGQPVVIRVGRSEEELRANWRWWVIGFALGIPFAVVIALGGGYVLAGRALAPLGRMIAHARTISAEQLSARLPVREPRDELGELASVFNATLTRLDDAFGRLRRFTADASHELRTPLTAMRAVGEVALRETQSSEAYRESIGSMLEETDRLTRLVDSLLTLSRWESGRAPAHPEPFDLGDLARDVAAHLSVLAEEKGLYLVVEAPPVADVSADRLMIRQAAINLVDNAIKFSPAGSTVTVRVTPTPDSCSLVVQDQGPGIPVEHQARVFDRFYRVDSARAREGGGTGLGLAIAHWAVTANGGSIALRSEEGKGSSFTIRLPAEAPTAV